MLTQRKASGKKNLVLISVFAVVLAVTAYMLYALYFQKAEVPPPPPGQFREKIVSTFETPFLTSEKYLKLKVFGQFPIVVKAVGNPSLMRVAQ